MHEENELKGEQRDGCQSLFKGCCVGSREITRCEYYYFDLNSTKQ